MDYSRRESLFDFLETLDRVKITVKSTFDFGENHKKEMIK